MPIAVSPKGFRNLCSDRKLLGGLEAEMVGASAEIGLKVWREFWAGPYRGGSEECPPAGYESVGTMKQFLMGD